MWKKTNLVLAWLAAWAIDAAAANVELPKTLDTSPRIEQVKSGAADGISDVYQLTAEDTDSWFDEIVWLSLPEQMQVLKQVMLQDNPLAFLRTNSAYDIADGSYTLDISEVWGKLYLTNSANSRKVEVEVQEFAWEYAVKIADLDTKFVAEKNMSKWLSLWVLLMSVENYLLHSPVDAEWNSLLDMDESEIVYLRDGEIYIDYDSESSRKIWKKENQAYRNDDVLEWFDVFPLIQNTSAKQQLVDYINTRWKAVKSSAQPNTWPRHSQSWWMNL